MPSFEELEESLTPIDDQSFVKKKILENGGGTVLDENCTVTFAYSGYWENEKEPFDVTTIQKPMVCSEVNILKIETNNFP